MVSKRQAIHMDSLLSFKCIGFGWLDSLTDSQPALFFRPNHDFVKFVCLFNRIVLY